MNFTISGNIFELGAYSKLSPLRTGGGGGVAARCSPPRERFGKEDSLMSCDFEEDMLFRMANLPYPDAQLLDDIEEEQEEPEVVEDGEVRRKVPRGKKGVYLEVANVEGNEEDSEELNEWLKDGPWIKGDLKLNNGNWKRYYRCKYNQKVGYEKCNAKLRAVFQGGRIVIQEAGQHEHREVGERGTRLTSPIKKELRKCLKGRVKATEAGGMIRVSFWVFFFPTCCKPY